MDLKTFFSKSENQPQNVAQKIALITTCILFVAGITLLIYTLLTLNLQK